MCVNPNSNFTYNKSVTVLPITKCPKCNLETFIEDVSKRIHTQIPMIFGICTKCGFSCLAQMRFFCTICNGFSNLADFSEHNRNHRNVTKQI